MRTIKLYIALICLVSISISAQEKNNSAPKSIYTFKTVTTFSSFETINKNLRLKNLSFVYANKKDIDNGNFSIPFKYIGKKPSSFILDDYNDYRDTNFLKGFLRKNDLTYWQPTELRLQ